MVRTHIMDSWQAFFSKKAWIFGQERISRACEGQKVCKIEEILYLNLFNYLQSYFAKELDHHTVKVFTMFVSYILTTSKDLGNCRFVLIYKRVVMSARSVSKFSSIGININSYTTIWIPRVSYEEILQVAAGMFNHIHFVKTKTVFPKLVGPEPVCGGSRKVFEMWFFNYIKIKNHKKWESERTKQN
jgi:hypothetical protein